MRFASPNEQRVISREYCGFYNALVIGAVYEFSGSAIDVRLSRSFFGAAKRCIEKHPSLSVIVQDMHTDAAFFERVPTMNLENHISIVAGGDNSALASTKADDGDEMAQIERLLPSILDRPWPASIPPWRIVVLPLSSSTLQGSERTRCFIAFSLSHALGDGIIALAFHRTFRDGIFDRIEEDCSTLATPVADFPAPFDTAKNLPISWRFLLRPLVAVLLPPFVTEALGLRATASAVNSATWTGVKMFFEPESFHSCLKLIEIPGPEVEKVLQVARKNGARLTATIHQSIVRALSRAIPNSEAGNFVSGTAVNMRRAFGISDDDMGFFTNACYESHWRADDWASPWSDDAWHCARSLTEKLADCAVTLQDQPVGLLRYVPSIRNWTAAKMGKHRDCSYELSNLGAFNAAESQDPASGAQCNITKMIFSRPVDATGAPLMLSAVSVKGGNLVISVVWQPGALGVPVESESTFVDGICTFLKEDLRSLE
ncbi:hypothetical protein ARAM_003772 [Aspergillus rambellii]|uniref:Alcohol acetyltransferase n=2 Tax=Aspergillus subgen. Nidulantes TaxID=2720870 RepID=A0A0F8VNF4_9EURO|nr:hypothetical protein AOCH_003000 [Aspergillus ochraceoroseus]KKK24681.1 hypothetical protein ARAM_003772 [Aspergillus rambellii]